MGEADRSGEDLAQVQARGVPRMTGPADGPEIHHTLREVGRLLVEAVPEDWICAVVVVTPGGSSLIYHRLDDGGRAQLLAAMREFLARETDGQ
jgi:hypothetical protein